jgi:imidazolonepropionase-like amidohydrolase
MQRVTGHRAALLLAFCFAGLLPALEGYATPAAQTEVTAITGATLIDGRDVPVRTGVTIVVANGRIKTVGADGRVAIPRDARVMNVRGMYVLPGFIDMHYHVTTGAMRYRRSPAGRLDSMYDRRLARRLLAVALSKGITTIRDPGASPRQHAVALRDSVRAGRVIGPRMLVAGDILSRSRMTGSEIRDSIQAQARDRVDFIKVYAGFSPHQVATAAREAHRHGLGLIGHLQRTSWTDAAIAGIDFITHGANWHGSYVLPGRQAAYDSMPGDMRTRSFWLQWLDVEGNAVDSMIRILAAKRIPVDPTLVAYHTKFWWRDSVYQHDPDSALVPEVLRNWRVLGMHTAGWTKEDFDRAQAGWPRQLALIRRMHAGGVLLTVGSDVASPWVIPGTAYHQELALLASAGLTPRQVLTMATLNGARALGISDSVGMLAPGYVADLVILSANPLNDINNSRSVRYVIRKGQILEPRTLLAR